MKKDKEGHELQRVKMPFMHSLLQFFFRPFLNSLGIIEDVEKCSIKKNFLPEHVLQGSLLLN